MTHHHKLEFIWHKTLSKYHWREGIEYLFSLWSLFLSGIATLHWPAVFWMHFLAGINILGGNLMVSEKGIRTFTVSNSFSSIFLSKPSSSLCKSHFKHCQMSTLPTFCSLNSVSLVLRYVDPVVTYRILWGLAFTSMVNFWNEATKKEIQLERSVAVHLQ